MIIYTIKTTNNSNAVDNLENKNTPKGCFSVQTMSKFPQ